MGALGGMGDAMQNIGGSMFKAELDRDARQADSDMALARAKALEEFKVGLGERDRAQMTERIDTATKGIIGGKIAQKANDLYGPGSNLTEADLADEEKQALALTDGEKAAARTQAAINTGYISPKDAATIERDERRLDATERATAQRETAAAMRDETQRYIAELREKTAQQRIEALIRKSEGGGKDGTREALSFLDGARKELQSEETSLRQMLKAEMEDKSSGEQKRIKAEYEPKLSAIAEKRRQIEQDFDSVRERVGLPARSTKPEAAAPAPKPAAALPLPKSKAELQTGKTYNTSRGPAKWNGTVFELVN